MLPAAAFEVRNIADTVANRRYIGHKKRKMGHDVFERVDVLSETRPITELHVMIGQLQQQCLYFHIAGCGS